MAQQERIYDRFNSRKTTRSLSSLTNASDCKLNINETKIDSPHINNPQSLPSIPSASSYSSDTIIENNSQEALPGSQKSCSSPTARERYIHSYDRKHTKRISKGKADRSSTFRSESPKLRRLKKRAELNVDKNLQRYCCNANFGLGVFLKIDVLCPGQSFVSIVIFLFKDDCFII